MAYEPTYKDGQYKWIEDADGKYRKYIVSSLTNEWHLDKAAPVYDENPDVWACKAYLKIFGFIVLPIALLSGLVWALKKLDSAAGSMSAGSAALIGYGVAGLVVLGLILGMIFSKSFRIVMLKVFIFILILAAVIGAVAFFCFK